MRRAALLLSLVCAAAAGAGCGDDDGGGGGGGDGGGGPVFDAAPGAIDAAQLGCLTRGTDLGIDLVAAGLDQPVFLTAPPGDPRLFVVELDGAIRIIEDGHLVQTPFLDIKDRVIGEFVRSEQGLLGLAFHPDYATTGRFFVYYTAIESDAGPEANVVAQYSVSPDDPNLADRDSEERVIEIADYATNHNAGMIAFDPDGYLVIATGDGGEGKDPRNNGQDKTTVLGDILRIDVDGGNPYAIPPDNPYVGSPAGEREEIWLSGTRNPFRWSFDRETGDMYIGDVGQKRWEEINVLPRDQIAGANLGWDEMEGEECFDDPVTETDPDADPDCEPSLYTLPAVALFHDPAVEEGHAAIIGGYVYRGACFPDIRGWYFYADHPSSRVWKFVYAGGAVTEHTEIKADLDPQGVLEAPAGFGEGADGELYILARGKGEVYRIMVREQ